jgi:acyl carrier protein
MLQIGMDKALVAELDPGSPLATQGVDSVDCPAFAVALEGKYHLTISDSDSLRLKTLNDFIAFVERAA